VIPLSWYSGWAIPDFDGGLILEQGTNYCVEAMNLMSFVSENGGQTVALITFPGDYGQDSAAGAKYAADKLGIDVVYDGEGVVIPGQDQTPVVTEIVNSGADWVFATTNPSTFAEIIGGAAAAGYQGMWTGSLPTWDFRLLDSPVAPLADAFFYQSAFNVTWGTDIPGMAPVTAAMQTAYPNRRPSDAFIIGWNEAKVMHQILEAALASGDLTRAGVLKTAQTLEVITLDGVAPDQTYAGTPNDYVVRETAVYKPDLDTYLAAGGADQKLSDGGTTGSVLAKDFFISDVAANFDFTEPCYSLG
ncbi:MAG: ABC transporter substrate-binding protein, partial [Acidimicrobiia bacterium]